MALDKKMLADLGDQWKRSWDRWYEEGGRGGRQMALSEAHLFRVWMVIFCWSGREGGVQMGEKRVRAEGNFRAMASKRVWRCFGGKKGGRVRSLMPTQRTILRGAGEGGAWRKRWASPRRFTPGKLWTDRREGGYGDGSHRDRRESPMNR
jgi:hypothetical protein